MKLVVRFGLPFSIVVVGSVIDNFRKFGSVYRVSVGHDGKEKLGERE